MAKDLTKKVEDLGNRLVAALGDNLHAFCLYGPAVRHDTRDGERTLTTLLIVRDATPAALRPIHRLIADWTRKGNPPPLIFGRHGWEASTDVFPIEIEDMREAHRLVRGRDPFEGITTTRTDLRRELEREVRGKLLRLRTEFAAAAPKGRDIEELLLDSVGTFFVLFRAVLRLTGRTPPQTPKMLIQETAAVTGMEASAFTWVLDKLVGHNVPALKAHDAIGEHYVSQVERLVEFVDTYDPDGAAQAPTQESHA